MKESFESITPPEASVDLREPHESIGNPQTAERREVPKEDTRMRIEEVRAWLDENYPQEQKIIKSLEAEKKEKERSPLSMLRELWKTTPSDCRASLVGEFIFNPGALKNRYYQEKYFQDSLKDHWAK